MSNKPIKDLKDQKLITQVLATIGLGGTIAVVVGACTYGIYWALTGDDPLRGRSPILIVCALVLTLFSLFLSYAGAEYEEGSGEK